MEKTGTRSSPRVSPEKDDEVKSQNLLMNPSIEICKFTNPEIQNLAPCFPPGTVFRPFDPSTRNDAISQTWFCFSTLPFILTFSYPFLDLTQRFFTLRRLRSTKPPKTISPGRINSSS
ncbi:hypothetical protein Hanom_Chr02g00136481 [Helianthus anomalus]